MLSCSWLHATPELLLTAPEPLLAAPELLLAAPELLLACSGATRGAGTVFLVCQSYWASYEFLSAGSDDTNCLFLSVILGVVRNSQCGIRRHNCLIRSELVESV